jgi:mannitol/fructose-specific phosphotransferase system IIA component (Ntr-type)
MLVDLLDIKSIELDFPKRRKHQIVDRLVELAGAAHPIVDPAGLVRDILQRDSEVSTAIGDGVAIPHKLTSDVSAPAMAFLQTRKPAGFSTPDGLPVRLCFLLLAPEGAVNEHLRTLSKLARILHDSRFRESLLEVTDPEEVLNLIRAHEQ